MNKFIVLLLIPILLVSCAKNPFSSRESEAPVTQAGTFIPPTSPQIALENLRLSYEELVIGNLIQSIDSNFVFRFDFIEGQDYDTAWFFNQEVELTENLFADFSVNRADRLIRIDFSFQAGQEDDILDTLAILVRGYDLTVVDTSGQELDSYHGVGKFRLVESAFNFWTLLAWEDIHLDTQTKSWAEFKNAYR